MRPNSDSEGRILFPSVPNNHDRFFFLHTFSSPAFDFNVGVAINESRFYTLASAILKVNVVCFFFFFFFFFFFGFNVAFNNFSVISRRCLVATGSSVLTELPH